MSRVFQVIEYNISDDTYGHFDFPQWEKTYVAVGEASTGRWHKEIWDGEEDVQISKSNVWVGSGTEEERTRKKNQYELSYIIIIIIIIMMFQLWCLKYEISSYTPDCYKLRFHDVACGTDMCHLIQCQSVAFSADVSSTPLSGCSRQYRFVSIYYRGAACSTGCVI
jgi:hypothetical protein